MPRHSDETDASKRSSAYQCPSDRSLKTVGTAECGTKEQERGAQHQIAQIFKCNEEAVGVVLGEEGEPVGLTSQQAGRNDFELREVVKRDNSRCDRCQT
jgi:hypothetical protein